MKNHPILRSARLFSGALTLSLFATNLPFAQAQPDLNNGPKADNPTNHPAGGIVDPVERMQQRFRRQLQVMGLNQVALQDAVIAYVDGESKARLALSLKGLELQRGLMGNALTDTQTTSLLNDYQAAIDEDKVRRTKAMAELVKTVDVSKFPKVESILTLMGMIGDGPALVGAYGQSARGMAGLGGGAALGRGGALGGNGVLGGAAGGAFGGLFGGGLGGGGLGGDTGLGGFGQAAPGAVIKPPQPTQPNIKPTAKPAPAAQV